MQLHVLYVKPYGRGRFGDADIVLVCLAVCLGRPRLCGHAPCVGSGLARVSSTLKYIIGE